MVVLFIVAAQWVSGGGRACAASSALDGVMPRLSAGGKDVTPLFIVDGTFMQTGMATSALCRRVSYKV